MKNKLIFLGSLTLIFLIVVLLRFLIFDKTGKMGRLKILSSPTAGVFIDSAAKGNTPLEIRLDPGEYLIKLIPEGESKGSVTWEGKAKVYEDGALTYITRDLGTSELTSAGQILTSVKMKESPSGKAGQVTIETDPPGAIVFLDNDEKGVAPLTLEEVPMGSHEMAVFLPGFFRQSQKINVDQGYNVQAKIKLSLDKTHKTLEQELEDKRNEATKEAEVQNTASSTSKKSLIIKDTPTGFLNVRDEPSVSGKKIAEVVPKEKYDYKDEKNGWYLITVKGGDEGWISGDYVEVNEE